MVEQQDKSTPACRVHILSGAASGGVPDLRFQDRFYIGRTQECDVCIQNEYVSRKHVEVFFEGNQWWVADLNSSNGMFVGGERLQRVPVTQSVIIRLGVQGPEVSLEVEKRPEPQRPAPVETPAADKPGEKTMIAQIVNRYFAEPKKDEAVGERTMYVRQAFKQVQKKQKAKYGKIMAALGVCILGLAGFALYQHQQIKKQKDMAKDIFYSMKSVDVEIANLEKLLLSSPSKAGAQEVQSFQSKRKAMEKSYDKFLASLHVYDPKLSQQDRIILRIARIFGECELDMPHDFVTEINSYIQKWQSSGRLARAIDRANKNGYTATITKEFLDNDLPPQFFYLGLQESDFDPYISGPMTRKGIAKGMWQFIPQTAIKYGLHLGPLVDLRRPDPGDDRHHYERETKAAAHYIKDLYGTDAQASGLLVMACYNWGEDYVLPLVRKMPENPRERNFWRLLAQYRDKIPQETYDYVFYISSAAVIGEDPRLFGFSFDNPLGQLESK